MAENNITGKNAVISWIWTGGTVSLNGDYRSVSINETTDLAETTAGSDTYKTHLSTIKSATIDYSGLFPTTAAGTVLVSALAAGNDGTLLVYPEGTAAGKLARSYPAISMGPKLDIKYNEVVGVTCSFTSNGAWS